MDGDFPESATTDRDQEALWCTGVMIDEAHSLGVMGKTGRGSFEHFGVDPKQGRHLDGHAQQDAGSCGGYICGSHDLVEILKYQAPGFVYSLACRPRRLQPRLPRIRILKSDPARVAALQAMALFRRGGEKGRPRHDDTARGCRWCTVMIGDSRAGRAP